MPLSRLNVCNDHCILIDTVGRIVFSSSCSLIVLTQFSCSFELNDLK